MWDINNGSQVRAANHGGPITAMSVKPDGQFVVTAGANVLREGQQVRLGGAETR